MKDVRVLWDKRRRVSNKMKQGIMKDLLGMSDIIQEAMEYTKEKTLKKRETEIIYWLNTNVGEDWSRIRIFYEPSQKGWYIDIYDDEDYCIGEIVSDTWPLCPIDADENTESEKRDMQT